MRSAWILHFLVLPGCRVSPCPQAAPLPSPRRRSLSLFDAASTGITQLRAGLSAPTHFCDVLDFVRSRTIQRPDRIVHGGHARRARPRARLPRCAVPLIWSSPYQASLIQHWSPVADCPLHVDVVVRAADGVGFGAHTANLLKYSDAFPGVEAPAAHGRGAVIRLSESADVVDLLLRFMHGGRQPALSALAVDTLAALAAAVERYQVYSAVELCKAHMRCVLLLYTRCYVS